MWLTCLLITATPIFSERLPYQTALSTVEAIEADLEGATERLEYCYEAVCLGRWDHALMRANGAAAVLAGFNEKYTARIEHAYSLSEKYPDTPVIEALLDRLYAAQVDAERLMVDVRLWVETVQALSGLPIAEWKAQLDALLEAPMSLPTSGYDLYSVQNPAGDVTNFPFYVDLSLMSASWWAAIDTTDFTKGRAAIHASETELACEWKNVNTTAKTGELYTKWSATIGAAGSNSLRVYPPMAANATVAAGDPYGSQAVWTGASVVWHMDDASSTTVADSTSNGNTGTKESANPTEITGKVGDAAQAFSGDSTSNRNRLYTAARTVTAPTAMSFSMWANVHDAMPNTYSGRLWSERGTQGPFLSVHDDRNLMFYWSGATALTHRSNNAVISLDTWHHIGVTWDGSNTAANAKIYVDGSEVGYQTTTNGATLANATGSGLYLGREATTATSDTPIDADIDEFRHTLGEKSSQWFAYEYANMSNPSSFWGTPTWVSHGTPLYYHRRRAN
jgi:hypothetical protein